ncbi:MAG: FAD-dependent oxidoreductase [Planctomycetes bacterium]|nr:FAD-dependent oxidoreductase [Planctomycetota bacterium]
MSALMIRNVVVLGGGSAGFMAAISLKTKLPAWQVRVLRSPDIGVIGVGEGTTVSFPRFLFDYLGLPQREFYAAAEPTWKLGIRFLWGPRKDFYYSFAREYEHTWPELRRNVGFFHDHETHWVGPISALMAHDRAFPRKPDGTPNFNKHHAFHIENQKLVAWLEGHARKLGVEIEEGNVTGVETGPVRTTGREENGVLALVLADGQRVTADLFVDASGFRSELLGRALGEPHLSYAKSLFCDRAVIGGWERTDEITKPYTTAETMAAGWAWQIEHEHFINRGYVYSSAHLDDEAARAELLQKNPKIPADRTRVIGFQSGRRQRNWIGNVVGIGNSVGFVEPLEATALQVVVVECVTLCDALVDCDGRPGPLLVDVYNEHNTRGWDEIRDFLAVHYAFNTRLDTPFWRDCREQTDLAGAARMVEWYRENGPTMLAKGVVMPEINVFGMEGYLAMLVGQKVHHRREFRPTSAEKRAWQQYKAQFGAKAKEAMTVAECLGALRRVGWLK